MTSDELPRPPRKRRWKRWIVALACVVAVTIVALLPETPKKEPVRVWFVRSTNEMGTNKLVFRGTNSIAREIAFSAWLFTGAIPHGKAQADADLFIDVTYDSVAARTNFYFALNAPPNAVPYYVEWKFVDLWRPKTRWYIFRLECCNFFCAHG